MANEKKRMIKGISLVPARTNVLYLIVLFWRVKVSQCHTKSIWNMTWCEWWHCQREDKLSLAEVSIAWSTVCDLGSLLPKVAVYSEHFADLVCVRACLCPSRQLFWHQCQITVLTSLWHWPRCGTPLYAHVWRFLMSSILRPYTGMHIYWHIDIVVINP